MHYYLAWLEDEKEYKNAVAALSLSERRKLVNRKQRWFTDNIIMHHKRLHDKNREIAVRLSYEKIIDKQRSRNPILSKQNISWCQRVDVKNRALLIKERLRARLRF